MEGIRKIYWLFHLSLLFPVPWLLPESGEMAKASDNQVKPMREIMGPSYEKLYLEVGEATPRMEVGSLGVG